MIIGGLYEAVIDFRIIKYVKNLDDSNLAVKRELLATLASGNLRLSPRSPSDPKTKILSSLQPTGADPERTRHRLLSLIGAQSSFGGVVGSPVLFYIGAFVYNIIDLQNDPSDQDNAISLGFGIEWMIIVHVAIVSGTLLAANNPSTSSGIVGSEHAAMGRSRNPGGDRAPAREGWAQLLGWSKTYDTNFQPVSIWSRGANKMNWIQDTDAWKNTKTSVAFKESMRFSFLSWFSIFTLAFLLIVIPPASGGVVAWATPPRGIACRSLSFITYGGSQLFTTFLATLQAARPENNWLKGPRFLLISAPFWFFSLVAAIGGTVMQISGVYRNCICYAGSENWYNLKAKNPLIQVANDTEAARKASKYWIWMGVFATIFMALNCYLGWWYQMFIRRRFTEAVENMVVIRGVEPAPDNVAGDEANGAGKDVGIKPVRNPVPVRQDSFGLPQVRRDDYSLEMELMPTKFSSEERLLARIDMDADESREFAISIRRSADSGRA
ncbi:hypothetical protein PVAG01_01148 [Phlyctema vagabunda]|uniref:Uncharacterized protein n=1 Tax=Phlyctema vagabunda TaxID=108571 RepID=A0ABR4PWA7_9HELO